MHFSGKFLVVLIVLFPFNAFAEESPAIVILGDSLSAAFGMELSQSWPSLLQDRLTENGHAYRVFNSSIAGDTTQGGLARLPGLLSAHQPKVVIVELGANDGLRGVSLEVTHHNLSSMIQQSQSIGATVILAGIRIPPNYGRSYTEKFSGMYGVLADQYGTLLIPFILEGIALNPELLLTDGIHPTAAAQPLLLENVWSVLAPVLD
jgi:acyl-CoA thioesterase-1